MQLTIDLSTLLQDAAAFCVIVGSICGLWRVAKRQWRQPPDDGSAL
jgi:hypothetical protein